MHYVRINLRKHFAYDLTQYAFRIYQPGILTEEIRAWMWEQGIRYTVEDVSEISSEKGYVEFLHRYYIGFYTASDAISFKLRWV